QTVLEVLRAEGRAVSLQHLTRKSKCGPAPIQKLVQRGLARRTIYRIDRFEPEAEEAVTPTTPPTLNADQAKAWAELEPALKNGGFQPFLLFGVTGSGKTELYLRAIDEVVKQGKEALVLVPEISLTPQTIAAFKGRLGEVAVLHSHLQMAER